MLAREDSIMNEFKHISSLFEHIAQLEQDNIILREKLKDTQQELAYARFEIFKSHAALKEVPRFLSLKSNKEEL